MRHFSPPCTREDRGSKAALKVGVISDTHGLLRPEARDSLLGSDYIVHGGDIGGEEILESLAAIAPVIAVKGNNDTAPWTARLRSTELIRWGDVFAYVIHDIGDLDIDPEAAGVSVVICGHSHQPSVAERDGITYVNPGSAGPRRFKLPIAMAEILVAGRHVTARILTL